jgi:hypothetical protein
MLNSSQGLPDLVSGELRLGRVRCFSTGRCPLRFSNQQKAIGNY